MVTFLLETLLEEKTVIVELGKSQPWYSDRDRDYFFSFCRDLSTEIELMLTTSLLPAHCHLIIEETIPRGMYVDPNQLRDLSESQGLQTYVAG